VIPRAGVSLLTPAAADFLRDTKIEPLRCGGNSTPCVTRLGRRDAQPPSLARTFAGARVEVERLVAEMTAEAAKLEPTLAGFRRSPPGSGC